MSSTNKSAKKQKKQQFKENSNKCDQKNNNISDKKSVQLPIDAAILGLLKTMARFGICLNNKPSTKILHDSLDNVCFVLINTYEKKNQDLGIGPLNDSIQIGLYHHRLGYKVYYLFNPKSDEFTNYLSFFLQNTVKSLTVFYSGLDSSMCQIHDIEFKNGQLSSNVIKNIITQKCNGKAKIIFITDSYNGGSVFDINSIIHSNDRQTTNIISFSVKKETNSSDSKEKKRSHGIFVYYFCKLIGDNPNITPKDLVESINPSILPFNEVLKYEVSNQSLADSPIFSK